MHAGTLELDCRNALQDLRGALLEAYASLGLDPDYPQQASRRLDLNKNLAWKISKIMTVEDELAAIQHLPGPSGLEIVLTTLAAAGVANESLDNVRLALNTFERVVAVHAGDRSDLDLMLDSMGLCGDNKLEISRELAFRGNSGIWGVQSRLRTTLGVVVPSKSDPERLDIAIVGGFVGFRMLRPNVSWRLFRFDGFTDDGRVESKSRREPLNDATRIGDVSLLRRFCSPNMPEISQVIRDNFREYHLPKGAVGNTGVFDCFFGDIARGLQRFASQDDSHGQFSSTVTLPVETMIFDVIVHKDIKMAGPPKVLAYGRPEGTPNFATDQTETNLLPLNERCTEIAGRPLAVSIASVPTYGELVQSVYASLGFTPMEFRGYRAVIKHPPLNASVMLRWDLEARP